MEDLFSKGFSLGDNGSSRLAQFISNPQPATFSEPVQSKPESLSVKLKNREHGFYANMLALIDKRGEGKVGGKEAVDFFKASGLSVDKLK